MLCRGRLRRFWRWQMTDLARDELGLVALAAWLNVTPAELPQAPMFRNYPNNGTKEAWERVGAAVAEYMKEQEA